MSYHIVWNDVLSDETYTTFEHPMNGSSITKKLYHDTYGKILDQLDGSAMSLFVDFWFERSVLDSGLMRFKDDDLRQDFMDWIQEEDIEPTNKEIMEGENDEDKKLRKNNSETKSKQKSERKPIPTKSSDEQTTDITKINRMYEALVKMREKTERAESNYKSELELFREKYPSSIFVPNV